MRNRNGLLSLLLLAVVVVSEPAAAQRRGGGSRGGGGMRGGGGGMRSGGGGMRATARPSITSRGGGGMSRAGMGGGIGQRPASSIGSNVNRGNINGINGGNVNRGNVNRAVDNRNLSASDVATYRNNTNINRPIVGNDIDIDNGNGWNNGYNGCCYHPVAAGAAVVAGAAITAAAIGSVSYALPSDCVVSVVNGVTYSQCGSTWYEPQFNGTTTTYVVVSPP